MKASYKIQFPEILKCTNSARTVVSAWLTYAISAGPCMFLQLYFAKRKKEFICTRKL